MHVSHKCGDFAFLMTKLTYIFKGTCKFKNISTMAGVSPKY